MQPTMTTADWLRRAADAWSEADTTQDQEARRVKVILAEGYERLARHAAYLADYDVQAARGRQSNDARFLDRVYRYLSTSVRARRLRTAEGRM
jgi:hypothetical protein